ncbi:MAG: hypothetical protein QM535_03255 [Limnohabitans sp.]|nr:hypothetical protein [Limnohabitans sp.]
MRLIAILFLTIFLQIENNLQLVSSKKQKVLPGVQTQQPYYNFLITLKNKKRTKIVLDSVHIYDQNECWSTNFFLKDKKTTINSNTISLPAEYVLQIRLTAENKLRRINNNKSSGTKIVLFYKQNKQKKEFVINTFVEETITRR